MNLLRRISTKWILTVLAAVPAQTIARPITPTVPAAETPALAGVKE